MKSTAGVPSSVVSFHRNIRFVSISSQGGGKMKILNEKGAVAILFEPTELNTALFVLAVLSDLAKDSGNIEASTQLEIIADDIELGETTLGHA